LVAVKKLISAGMPAGPKSAKPLAIPSLIRAMASGLASKCRIVPAAGPTWIDSAATASAPSGKVRRKSSATPVTFSKPAARSTAQV